MSLSKLRKGDLVAIYNKEGEYQYVARVASLRSNCISIYPLGVFRLIRFNRATGITYEGAEYGVKYWFIKPYQENGT